MIQSAKQGGDAAPGDCAGDRSNRPAQIDARRSPAAISMTAVFGMLLGAAAHGQIPPPPGPARSTDLAARREAIYQAERQQRPPQVDLRRIPQARNPTADDSTRFVPLAEVVTASEVAPDPAETPAAATARLDAARQLFDLAMSAARAPSPPLAFIDDCLRATLARDPGHAEARRLLGFVPHGGGGWATPFAAMEMGRGKVKDRTFGWVPADWLPHLRNGELPAPGGSGRWLPVAEADVLRREWPRGWEIFTEHFEIHANVPFADAIAFGGQLETFHQLFFAIMADLIGPDRLPLAQRLRLPGKAPTVSSRPRHKVYYFATRDEYKRHLAPIHGGADVSLGIYLPRKEFGRNGNVSYFFNDVGGQLDITATLYHEVSHQLLFESADKEDYGRNVGNFWVFEGLGTYFETVETAPDGSLRVGGLVGPRLAAARKRIIDERDYVPLDLFVKMGREAFLGNSGGDVYLNYAEAMALAVFLMQAQHGKYREAFLDYARDAYRGAFRGGGGRPLISPDRVDQTYPELQREFLSFLANVR